MEAVEETVLLRIEQSGPPVGGGEEMAKFLRANGFEVLFMGMQATEPCAIGVLRAALKE